MTIIISIDKDVGVPGSAPRTSPWAPYADQLRKMDAGDSFFVAKATRRDLTGLVNYARNLGITLEAHEVDEDEIFVTAGVRVWCMTDMPPRAYNKPVVAPTPFEEKIAGISKSEEPVAEVNSETPQRVSRYWRMADGHCLKVKRTLVKMDDAVMITADEYETWLEDQEL